MRSRLLHSFCFVLGFWWLAAAFTWSVLDPEVSLEALKRVAALFPWVSISAPEHVTVLDAWNLQKQVLAFWSAPLFVVTGVLAGLGATGMWLYASREQRARDARTRSEGEYRGVTVSLGTLPLPLTPVVQPTQLRASDDSLKRLSDEQRALLSDVLGMLAANPHAFIGDGRPAGTLFGYALKVAHIALCRESAPALTAIAAAANELGMITAWKQDATGDWQRVRSAEREAARSLAGLASWWELPTTERLAVLFAVKYRSAPDQIPRLPLNPKATELARQLIAEQARLRVPEGQPAVGNATAAEPPDPQARLLQLFERELATLPIQTSQLPPKTPAAGFRKGRRVYLLENRLNDCLHPVVSNELPALLNPSPAGTSRVAPLTAALLHLFHVQGWLVLQHENDTVEAAEALWVIRSGTISFYRVIILDLPPEMLARLPNVDSHYPVSVLKPFFEPPAEPSISKEDLGNLLRPKPASSASAAGQPSPSGHPVSIQSS